VPTRPEKAFFGSFSPMEGSGCICQPLEELYARVSGAMKKSSLALAASVMALLSLGASAQQDQMVPGHIRAVKVDGTAWQIKQAGGQRERLSEGDFLRQGNVVETASDGSVILLFDNGSTMNLRPGSKFSINEFLREPFDTQTIDYRKIEVEPSKSVTKVAIKEGVVFFDIPKLKIREGSSCDISNPVGTAGIRGTAGFVTPDSMGCSSGSFQATTQTGQSQTLGAGQSTGFTSQGNFGPPPNNANQNMDGARSNSQNASQNIPADAFSGAPQSQAASQGNLTQEQQESIEQAAQQGEEALIKAVEKIASESPESAPAAAAAAAALMPDAATQIASAAASAVPQNQATTLAPQIAEAVAKIATDAAPQIAAAVASVVTEAAPQVAAAVASVATQAAPQVAAAVAAAVTGAAPQIAAAVAQAVPNSAAEVAGAVTGAVPSQATSIAQSVAQVAPSQANSIAQAVTNAAPDADGAAIANAAQQGAQQGQSSNQTANSGGSGNDGGGASGGGGSAPPLPGGFGGSGGGGAPSGGNSGGGGIYSN